MSCFQQNLAMFSSLHPAHTPPRAPFCKGLCHSVILGLMASLPLELEPNWWFLQVGLNPGRIQVEVLLPAHKLFCLFCHPTIFQQQYNEFSVGIRSKWFPWLQGYSPLSVLRMNMAEVLQEDLSWEFNRIWAPTSASSSRGEVKW